MRVGPDESPVVAGPAAGGRPVPAVLGRIVTSSVGGRLSGWTPDLVDGHGHVVVLERPARAPRERDDQRVGLAGRDRDRDDPLEPLDRLAGLRGPVQAAWSWMTEPVAKPK